MNETISSQKTVNVFPLQKVLPSRSHAVARFKVCIHPSQNYGCTSVQNYRLLNLNQYSDTAPQVYIAS